jgi:DNA-directed RNA polymerase specialized sigma24 family protein
MDDHDIVSALASGPVAGAFALLSGPLSGFVYTLLRNADDADDIVQDVFVDAIRTAKRGDPPFAPDSTNEDARRWLFRAVYLHTLSFVRKQANGDKAFTRLVEVKRTASNDPQMIEELIAERAWLFSALSKLTIPERACVWLHFVLGYTAADLMPIFQWTSLAAARKRLSRALEHFRTAYFAVAHG